MYEEIWNLETLINNISLKVLPYHSSRKIWTEPVILILMKNGKKAIIMCILSMFEQLTIGYSSTSTL